MAKQSAFQINTGIGQKLWNQLGWSGERRANTSELDAETEANYQYAANYYLQKKRNFFNLALDDQNKRRKKIEDAFTNQMDWLIQNEWNKINEAMLNFDKGLATVSSSDDNTQQIVKYSAKNGEEKEVAIDNELFNFITTSSNADIFSRLGFGYEKYIANAMQNMIMSVGSKAFNDLINQFGVSGGIKMSQAMRQASEIRADVAFGVDDKGRSIQNPDLGAELNFSFDIQNARHHQVKDKYMDLLQRYKNDSTMFGFSLKRWDSTESNKHFTSMSGLRTVLNALYEKADDKTWNLTYAYHTMLNVVSRYLINLLGPIDIAYIFGDRLVWADSFVETSVFYMNMYTDLEPKNGEGKPYIASGNVYRSYNARKKYLQKVYNNSTHGQTDEGKDWYRLNFKIT